ncbi:PAP/fibrillin family protein [Candidatus Synechococcus calcipolaris G9]|uniref:PAP/fibrillin family protein n=1 Tax=Candidatus Synechococcus calcipolaris G9 TaxID=1497997 RepID=A0ABT6EWA7_9SYNE|nr:PAP/fibrillin family protein [Candidatus Synechococcus calcipolaris]MDG2989403.1 PAP/fibrillin family protein [Candidatus Synechococcus calcipolaris G9]
MTKTELLGAIAGLNRGILASPRDRKIVAALAKQVEAANPTPDPFGAVDKLGGDWRLLYTSSQSLLALDRSPVVKLGNIYQCIRPQQQLIYNIAEVYGVPLLEGVISVLARFEPRTEQRAQVYFERSIVGFRNWLNYYSPSQFIPQLQSSRPLAALDLPLNSNDQQGWLDITYLDQDLRIARGNEGSLFILARV